MSKATPRASNAPKQRLAEDGGASFPLSSSLRKLSLQQQQSADSPSDICNVCKSSRYLNPNMRFLVNPECYHKMCESCVDRIFSHGPAPCPIAGCKRTLRKVKFRSQTFEDLKVEREVDIRRRVAKVMNKQESDFENLLDYNNYLETVEEMTWNLILEIDVPETNRKLKLFEAAQKAELNPNATFRPIDDQPNTSTLSDTSHVVLKKGGTQRKALATSFGDPFGGDDMAGGKDTGFVFKGLKKREAPKPESPFDPFDGWSVDAEHYNLQDNYDHQWIQNFKTDPEYYAGGWIQKDYWNRMMMEALGGMAIFIEDEIVARENAASGDAGVGTENAAGAALGGKDVDMMDVF
ncbi:CDK-activating kinase assembly factor [Massarina eburnea CBS 473.64]|uniref:RNA polymerase II transcription factor B subunit 3 n=1 Tax=Massarina eburnea CBS 473.64 TaxID=1395130 RepID=A0A6A6RNK2_9PLEO|nr:CDK-activating kinase assembly factor [Massarina eburnea CBS 473.64]